MSEPPDFIPLLDEQAVSLLLRLKEEAKLDGKDRLSVMDHVRGFAAVTDYVATRQKIAPPEREKSKFEVLRDRISEPKRKQRADGRAAGDRGGHDETEKPAPGPPPPVRE